MIPTHAITDIERALQEALPPEHQTQAAALARALATGRLDPALRPALGALAGREITGGGALISFGSGSQLGDVSIGDVVGGDKITIAFQLPPSRLSPQEQRNRRAMLQKVRAIWVDGLLSDSLAGIARLDIELQSALGRVALPFQTHVQPISPSARDRILGGSIHAIFHQTGGRLLILGGPGAGKTTLLLELARELISQAERDEVSPIPAVFNLASWSVNRSTIEAWLTKELVQQYDVPRRIAASWMADSMILPLLDGLDEVAPSCRSECVNAINAYQRAHMTPLAICSRASDYDTLPNKLRLQGAILIEPLEADQVRTFLNSEPSLHSLSRTIEYDQKLLSLAQTPLMLRILQMAYQGRPSADGLLQEHSIWNAYITSMWNRRAAGVANNHSFTKTLRQLRQLAQHMAHGQASFFIEYLQVSWLDGFLQRAIYSAALVIAASGALFIGVMLWISIFLFVLFLIVVIINYVFTGTFEWLMIPSALGGSLLMLAFIVISPALPLLLASMLVLPKALCQLLYPNHPSAQITPQETFTWSWRRGLLGIALGAAGSAAGAWWLTNYLASFTSIRPHLSDHSWPITLLTLSTAILSTSGLTGGLSSGHLPTRSKPNEGIHRSLRSSLRFGLGGGALIAIVSFIALVIGSFLTPNAFAWLFRFGLPPDSWVVLMLLPLWAAPILGFVFGGYTVLQHYLLRAVLAATRAIPWRLRDHLDQGVKRALLYRVGGSYIFVHRLLMEHIAAMTDEEISRLSADIAAEDPQR